MYKPHLIEIAASLANYDFADLEKPYLYHVDGRYYAEAKEWRAPYVCEYTYSEFANAVADCKECGWPIAKHNMVDQFAKGPFAPKTGADAK